MSESTELKRSDARRNRDAIVAAALDALTASPEVSLNAIAKRAGVANATLYRHFPTREALVLATYKHEVRSLVDAAGSLLQERAPIDALRSWVERLARFAVTKHGLADALRKATRPGSDLSSTDTYDAIDRAGAPRPSAGGEHLCRHAAPKPQRRRRHPRACRPLAARPCKRLESPSPAHLRHRPQRPTAADLTLAGNALTP